MERTWILAPRYLVDVALHIAGTPGIGIRVPNAAIAAEAIDNLKVFVRQYLLAHNLAGLQHTADSGADNDTDSVLVHWWSRHFGMLCWDASVL